jgi:hypothetical protein
MDQRAENQVTTSENVSANVTVFFHKHQEEGVNDRPFLNLPHIPDTRRVLYDDPASDFSHRGPPLFSTFCDILVSETTASCICYRIFITPYSFA